jgi:hypothetical protein
MNGTIKRTELDDILLMLPGVWVLWFHSIALLSMLSSIQRQHSSSTDQIACPEAIVS